MNLNSFDVVSKDLPFKNLFKIHHHNDFLYVIEGNHISEDNALLNKIAKINIQTGNINLLNSKNNSKTSYIKNNEFISSDGNKIYIYMTLKHLI